MRDEERNIDPITKSVINHNLEMTSKKLHEGNPDQAKTHLGKTEKILDGITSIQKDGKMMSQFMIWGDKNPKTGRLVQNQDVFSDKQIREFQEKAENRKKGVVLAKGFFAKAVNKE